MTEAVSGSVGKSGRPLTAKAAEALALQLQAALAAPSFVPYLARPVWRFTMNQAIPLDSLLLVPERILVTLEERPEAGMGAVAEAVLLAVATEGLGNLKSRYRIWGLSGVFGLYGALGGAAAYVWPV